VVQHPMNKAKAMRMRMNFPHLLTRVQMTF
jgi:hypothetical protein